jgi:multidrug efflux system membrane fusion protein
MNKLLYAIAALTGMLLISSCGSKEAPKEIKIRPVKSMIIGDIGDATGKGFPGVTKETKESEMSFRVGGPIVRLNVRDGARVNKGALIAEIDPRDYRVNVQSTEARYNQTKAESDRFYRLWQKGSVAKIEYERRFANYQEAEAAWEDAKNALIDTKLFAPYGGFFGSRLVDLGEEVIPKQAVTTIVDLSVIEVTATIPEQLAVQLLSFEKYEVHIEAYPDEVFTARLKEMEKKPTAEGFPLHLFLDHVNNPNDPNQAKVSAGMSCRINILLKKAEDDIGKIIVPITAVFESNMDDQTAVWIIDPQSETVSKQEVVVGNIIGNDAIEIVEGIEMGQQIVVAGVHRLTEGEKIKILDSE